eukprot:UN16193
MIRILFFVSFLYLCIGQHNTEDTAEIVPMVSKGDEYTPYKSAWVLNITDPLPPQKSYYWKINLDGLDEFDVGNDSSIKLAVHYNNCTTGWNITAKVIREHGGKRDVTETDSWSREP